MDIIKALQIAHGDVAAAAQFINVLAGPQRRNVKRGRDEDEDDLEGQPPLQKGYLEEPPPYHRGDFQKLLEQNISDALSTATTQERFDYFNRFALNNKPGLIGFEARVYMAAFDDLRIPYNDIISWLISLDQEDENINIPESFEWGMTMLSHVYKVNVRLEKFLGIALKQLEARGLEVTLSSLFRFYAQNVHHRDNLGQLAELIHDRKDDNWFRRILAQKIKNRRFYDLYEPFIMEYANVELKTNPMATEIYYFLLYSMMLDRFDLDDFFVPIRHWLDQHALLAPLRKPFSPFSKQWFTMPLYDYLDYHGHFSFSGDYLVYYIFDGRPWYPDLKKSVLDFNLDLEHKFYTIDIFENLDQIKIRTMVYDFKEVPIPILSLGNTQHDIRETRKELSLINFAYRTFRDSGILLFGNFDIKKISLPTQWILKTTSFRGIMRDLLDRDEFMSWTDDELNSLYVSLEILLDFNKKPVPTRNMKELNDFLGSLKDPDSYDFNDVISKILTV